MLSNAKSVVAAVAALSMTPAVGWTQADIPEALRSRLDSVAEVSGFGNIAYREPLRNNEGPTVVLFPGIYGGTSHLTWRELLPRLDTLGFRVFVMDLPGTGASDKPERDYAPEDVERFVVNFTREVVGEPAILVGQATVTMFVLNAAKELGRLNQGVVLTSPVGVNVLAQGPTPREQAFFDQVRNNRAFGLQFYRQLLDPATLGRFVENGFYDRALVTETFLAEYALQRENVEQRWISFNFIGGQLFRPFTEAAAGVDFPVLMVFGADDVGVDGDGDGANRGPDRQGDFEALRPDFSYVTFPRAAGLVWKEKPGELAVEIAGFARQIEAAQDDDSEDDDD